MNLPFKIVGHRGLPEAYPENSLLGAVAALESGADGLEIDVQLTADGRVVVVHDSKLKRTSSPSDKNADQFLSELKFSELKYSSIHEPSRFADQFFPEYLMGLEEFCTKVCPYLKDNKKIFIEIKQQSIEAFGIDFVVNAVIAESDALANHRVFISFNDEALVYARRTCGADIGWILTEFSDDELRKAEQLSSEYMITDIKIVPDSVKTLPTKSSWFVYDVVDPEIALAWHQRGAQWIETWDCRRFQ